MDSTIRQLFVRHHARYTSSPCAADLAAFARWLLDTGYDTDYAQRLVFRAKRCLEEAHVPSGQTWTATELALAFRRRRQRLLYRHAQHAFRSFLESAGRLATVETTGPYAAVIAAYERHLEGLRGLAPDTIKRHRWQVGAFLERALRDGEGIGALDPQRIEQYIQDRSRTVARRSLLQTVDTLRAFLRFCFGHQLIGKPLYEIDRPVCFRDELPPRALPLPLIRRLLHSIDRHDRTGWRDFMILHLMAHYGLRPGETTKLKLESFNWKDRTMMVEQTKTRSWLILPLSDQTLGLLRRYLESGRRKQPTGPLFQTACAPIRPMTKYGVSQVFRLRARKSGLPIMHATAYSLRHSFAMRLFARGVGIKTIGDLMGHGSIVSTAVYLRLQTDVLREVALPVPSGHGLKGGVA